MSKIISFRGKLDIGLQDKLNLKTLNGKTGYKITKFQLMSTTPGINKYEYISQIFKTDQTGSIGTTVDFTDNNLLAVAYLKGTSGANDGAFAEDIIFDNEKFNQNIFINITDASGGTVACNYYIELETMTLDDIESSMLTLKSLRTIASQ